MRSAAGGSFMAAANEPPMTSPSSSNSTGQEPQLPPLLPPLRSTQHILQPLTVFPGAENRFFTYAARATNFYSRLLLACLCVSLISFIARSESPFYPPTLSLFEMGKFLTNKLHNFSLSPFKLFSPFFAFRLNPEPHRRKKTEAR